MAIKRMDEVLAAIAAGKSNTEIRDEIDGRIGDKAINQLRKHPANADVPWPEDALRYEAEQAARAKQTVAPQAETAADAEQAGQAAAPAAEEEQVPFVPEPEETVPKETVPEETAPETGCTTAPKKTKAAGAKVPEWSRMTTGLIEEIDPPMTMATAIRELVRYVMTDDVDHLIEAALAINARMNKEKRRIKR